MLFQRQGSSPAWLVGAAILALLKLAGCGGGGSGSDDDPTHVSLAAVSPSDFTVQIYQDESASSPTLHLGVSGNVQALDGQTIYAITENPLALFRGTHQLTLNANPPSADIVLNSSPDDRPAPGVYENEIKLYACLDASCNRMLRNAPLKVHYKVTVLARS